MKVKHVLIAIVSLGLLCSLLIPAPAAVVAADNLAANGDFELGNTNGWEIGYATLETATVHSGAYSLKLTATSAYSGAAYKSIPVRKNATITVSFYYRYASAPGSNKTYHVYTYQGADANVGPYSNADAAFAIPSGCTPIDTWQQITYTFNSGDYDNIYLKFSPGGNGSSACYIDDLVVTSEGGDESEMAPYLTSFGTKHNRPVNADANLIVQGGFESTANASWNTQGFLSGGIQVVEDATAPEGSHSLFFDGSAVTTEKWHGFVVNVEPYTQYTFSAWVKSPRLSAANHATASFGVANNNYEFLVYEAYNGDGYGVACKSTETMQLMATSPDDEWHLRSVTFYSGSHKSLAIAIYGAQSQLYLDDIALYKSSNGIEYVSSLRTDTISDFTNSGNKYCADEDSLIKGIYMTTNDAQLTWSDNPAWRNGFLSFVDSGDNHGTVLKYTASSKTNLKLHYVDWIDVKPNTDYTLTLDVKRLSAGNGRIALLDDNYTSPAEFYTLSFSSVDSDWVTYSVTFNSESYSRIGFAIVDGGGSAYIDEVRLFESSKGIADEPTEPSPQPQITLKPVADGTAVMEVGSVSQAVLNNEFENGANSWDIYQGTMISTDAAHSGDGGAHLKGDGGWGALIEQCNIPVVDGETYTISFWYKVNKSGTNITLLGSSTGAKYAYLWANSNQWTYFTATFTVEGDTTLRLNACGAGNGVAEDVYLDDVSILPNNAAILAVAFRFHQDGLRIYKNNANEVNLASAAVLPYGDGESYRLVRMGAVVTNRSAIGNDENQLVVSAADGASVADVPVLYVMEVSDTGCDYAVRLVDIPLSHADTPVYARPYYVFEKDGEEIFVYGDVVSRSYNG